MIFQPKTEKMILFCATMTLAIFVLVPVVAKAAGAGITYHGRLVDKDGHAVESSNVQFKLQIRTPGNENCLMYEEVQVKDLSQASGAFAVTLNDGTGTRLDSTGFNLEQIFANRNAYTFVAGNCTGGNSYTPNPTDSRRIQVLFNDGTFPIGQWEPVPPMAINFVPMAIESMQVGGYKKEQLIKIADGISTTGTELNLASWTELLALIAGTSTQFIKPNNANFTAAPTWSGTPTTANDLTNKTYVDTQIAAGLPNVGTAGTYTKVTTDAKGRVTSGATLAEADLPNITTAGKVAGGAINAGTIGGATAVNTSGNLYSTGTVTGLTVSATNLRVYNGTDYVQFTAPALSGANVLFTLPAADGTAGQVLKTNGAGILSWISPSSGSVTGAGTTNYLPMFTAASTLGDSPIAASAGNVGIGTASPNTALDLNGAQSYRGIAAPAVSIAGQGRMYFDSTSNTFKMSKNAGSYGDVAFGNCALNEVLKWNGTTWACAADATGTAPADSSYATKGIVQFLTDAATSGITVAAGVANVNMGTGANQVVQLTAATKYPAVDGSLITNIAATNMTGVLPIANGGTNSSTALNNGRLMASVGGAIVETAAMTDGQFVVGKTGSAPQLVTMSGDATVSNLGAVTLATVSVTKGGTATTSYGNNKVIVSNGTGSALVAASCALNQVISFDAGGSLTCANVSDLSTAYQNGGNSFGANATLGTNDNFTLGFKANNSVAMTILGNGNLGIGTTNPASLVHAATSTTATGISTLEQASADADSYDIKFRKARGTVASPTVITTADELGTIQFNGYSGAGGYVTGAAIKSISEGTIATTRVPANLSFWTGTDAAPTVLTERMRIDKVGNVGIGTTAPAAALEVAGDVKVGNSSAACSATTKGSIRYNNTSSVLEFCNGTAWNLVQAAACSDATPNVFSFTDEPNATTSTLYTSDIVQIAGINCTVPVTVSGGGSPQYQICSDAACSSVVQGWTSSPSSIVTGQYLQSRQTSDAVGGSPFQATIIVGSGATVWTVTTTGSCAGSPAVGTLCADGTIYAGLSPDGNVPMYATRCDAGQTWSGVACTGSRTGLSWNNGSWNWTSTGRLSVLTGKSNSAALNALADAGSVYAAAAYCESLSLNGQTDWYLPAVSELNVLYSNKAVVRNFDTSGVRYWASTEYNTWNWQAAYQRFSDGAQGFFEKNVNYWVRCVRR